MKFFAQPKKMALRKISYFLSRGETISIAHDRRNRFGKAIAGSTVEKLTNYQRFVSLPAFISSKKASTLP
jgi:hypothetical protein